jgi:EpsI family protein
MSAVSWSKSWHRKALAMGVLILVAAWGQNSQNLKKIGEDKRIGFANYIPETLGDWRNIPQEPVESGGSINYNEMYQALFSHPELGRMALTIEYTSDSRQQFELHYPDVCHEARGDQIVPFPSRNFKLQDGNSVQAAMMSWQQVGGGHDALAAYWYVTPEGVTSNTVKLKWDQALAGLLRRPTEAVMVRFDSFYHSVSLEDQRETRIEAIRNLLFHMSQTLEPELSQILFNQLEDLKT